jgi:hypothetical protein
MYTRYEPATARVRVLMAALSAWALVAFGALLADSGRVDVLKRVATGLLVTESDARVSDSLVMATSWLEMAAYVAAGVAFFAWLRRLSANNRVLSAYGAGVPSRMATLSFGAFLICGIAGYAVSLTAYQAEEPFRALIDSTTAQLVAIVAAGAAALLCDAAVVAVTRRQSTQANAIAASVRAGGESPAGAGKLAAIRGSGRVPQEVQTGG